MTCLHTKQAHLRMSLTDCTEPSGLRLIAVIFGMELASTPAQMPDALQPMNCTWCNISALRLREDEP